MKIKSCIWILLALGFSFSGFGARFSQDHGSIDGGGGVSIGRRFAVSSAIVSILEPGHLSLADQAPVVGRDQMVLPGAGPFVISVEDLVENDSSLDGNVLELASLPLNSAQGGNLVRSNDTIIYTPPAVVSPRGDSFTYVVTNSMGIATSGKVVLAAIAAVPRFVGLERAGTNVNFHFQALANEMYLLQFRPSLGAAGVWVDHPSPTAPLIERSDTNGIVAFAVPVSIANGFFRAVDVQSLREELKIGRAGNRLFMTLRGVPREIYKLQFRDALDASQTWRDFPNERQPLTMAAANDGFYEISTPILSATGFFRTVPR